MGLVEALGRRRWRRQLQHNFVAGEDIVTYGEVIWLGGSQGGAGLMFATQFALYQPAVSADLRIPYAEIDEATFDPRGTSGNGVLRLSVRDVGLMEYACRAPREFGRYIVDRVEARAK